MAKKYSVPVAVAAKVYGKNPAWVRSGIILQRRVLQTIQKILLDIKQGKELDEHCCNNYI